MTQEKDECRDFEKYNECLASFERNWGGPCSDSERAVAVHFWRTATTAADAKYLPVIEKLVPLVRLLKRDAWARAEFKRIQAGIMTEGRMRAIEDDESLVTECDEAIALAAPLLEKKGK